MTDTWCEKNAATITQQLVSNNSLDRGYPKAEITVGEAL